MILMLLESPKPAATINTAAKVDPLDIVGGSVSGLVVR